MLGGFSQPDTKVRTSALVLLHGQLARGALFRHWRSGNASQFLIPRFGSSRAQGL